MVTYCCAVGCKNRMGTPNIKFYRFPVNLDQRKKWISALKREKWTHKEHSRLCSAHFQSGKWSPDPRHIDYVPTVFVYSKQPTTMKSGTDRYRRAVMRSRGRNCLKPSSVNLETNEMSVADVKLMKEIFGGDDDDDIDGGGSSSNKENVPEFSGVPGSHLDIDESLGSARYDNHNRYNGGGHDDDDDGRQLGDGCDDSDSQQRGGGYVEDHDDGRQMGSEYDNNGGHLGDGYEANDDSGQMGNGDDDGHLGDPGYEDDDDGQIGSEYGGNGDSGQMADGYQEDNDDGGQIGSEYDDDAGQMSNLGDGYEDDDDDDGGHGLGDGYEDDDNDDGGHGLGDGYEDDDNEQIGCCEYGNGDRQMADGYQEDNDDSGQMGDDDDDGGQKDYGYEDDNGQLDGGYDDDSGQLGNGGYKDDDQDWQLRSEYSDGEQLGSGTHDDNGGQQGRGTNNGVDDSGGQSASLVDSQLQLELESSELEVCELQHEVSQLQTQSNHLKTANSFLLDRIAAHRSATSELQSTHNMEISRLKKENETLKLRVKFGAHCIKDDDKKTCFYTGLHKYSLFHSLFTLLNPHLPYVSHASPIDELFLVLVKLRLGVPHEDLAYRTGYSLQRISQIFHKWIDLMSIELKCLIQWPDDDCLRQNMPDCFRKTSGFSRVKCIIDCFEIFIDRPVNFQARAATYSNYKKHNTAKVFIAIAPTGSISFISNAWGGRVSDKVITQKSGFLNFIERGDVVLADRGFNISDELACAGAYLKIPSFTKGKVQLSQREVEVSRQLARVRIHVERVIGQLRKKYKILSQTLPISLITCPRDSSKSNCTLDRILIVTAALTNLSPSVV